MLDALIRATRSQLQPRMLALVLWPLLGSLLFWGVAALLFWQQGLRMLSHVTSFAPVDAFLYDYGLQWLASSLFVIVLLLVLPTLVAATALFITSVIAMPIMVRQVAALEYPGLELRHGGTTAGSVWNAIAALLVYLGLWVLILPLLLILPIALPLPILLNGYLNDRVFRYDALAEHASREEYRELLQRRSPQLFGLGVVAALIQMVPLVNLVSPVWSGLSFIHYTLAELERSRAAQVGSGILRLGD